jgi:hypothetical protein
LTKLCRKSTPYERQQRHLLTRRGQLLRHLKGDGASGAVSDDHVWAMGLMAADLPDLISRERLYRPQGFTAVKAWRLYADDRLVGV